MRLGVDFGTTRIIVAAADRGNFPLVSFESGDATVEWFPSLIALRGTERLYGWDAWGVLGQTDWTIVRSIKRYLDDAGPETIFEADGMRTPLRELLLGLTSALKADLTNHFGPKEPLEIMLGVPANANSNQRFLTVDAFQRAGFSVLGLLNEPSAASIEFGHRRNFSGRVLVYDLGGGTFDASLVDLDDHTHTVVATEGIASLGGDDFDRVLAKLSVSEKVLDSLSAAELFRLDEECRRQKEALHPSSRRIVIDLDVVREGLGTSTGPVSAYYEACRPLLDQTVEAALHLAGREEIDALYITGGGSELPIVARVLREEFGKKVKRSEYTRSATAIGLAIQAAAGANYTLREVFTRNFGVWRESNAGSRMLFDPIFPAGTRLPAATEPILTVNRDYSPMHNIGHFRYLESSLITDEGQPGGDIAFWDEILFPFDPTLAGEVSLERIPVEPSIAVHEEQIEERYTCDATGTLTVTIRNLTSAYHREYKLGRWSGKAGVVKPSAKRPRKTSA